MLERNLGEDRKDGSADRREEEENTKQSQTLERRRHLDRARTGQGKQGEAAAEATRGARTRMGWDTAVCGALVT